MGKVIAGALSQLKFISRYMSKCKKLEEIMLDRDAFGQGFAFTLPNGKETYNTWFGTITTFLLYGLLIVYGSMKMQKVYGYGSSAIDYAKQDSFFDAEFTWNSTMGMQFAFGITHYDDDQEPVDDE